MQLIDMQRERKASIIAVESNFAIKVMCVNNNLLPSAVGSIGEPRIMQKKCGKKGLIYTINIVTPWNSSSTYLLFPMHSYSWQAILFTQPIRPSLIYQYVFLVLIYLVVASPFIYPVLLPNRCFPIRRWSLFSFQP